MSDLPQSYFDRVDAGIGFRWAELPPRVASLAAVDPAAEILRFERVGSSHRGLGTRASPRMLMAYGVDAGFLEEIATLTRLETLYMERVTASDLSALARLPSLRRLVINGASRVESLAWVAALSPTLRSLAVENARRIRTLDELATLTQLETLAIEGSLHAAMRVASLEPLRGLHGLHALFLTALRVEDGRLSPLASLTGLRVLEFADYYAAGEIDMLARALPAVRCSWFEARMRPHRREFRRPLRR